MRLAFLDFWPGFDPHNNFFLHTLRSFRENVTVCAAGDADAVIYSCFGTDHLSCSGVKKVFYTGENIRPNFEQCNHAITFDFDTYDGRNTRLPLWYLYIDWYNVGTYGNPEWLIPTSYLTGDQEFSAKEKSLFCSTVFSNPEKTRFEALEHLNKYKEVDCYGAPHKNKLKAGEKAKLNVQSNYKFSLCFENSIYPGYFTEKLLHAKISGAVPIYYSDISYSEDFNPECCVNLIEFNSLEALSEKVIKIDTEPSVYEAFRKSPLFRSAPNLEKITSEFERIF
jgi:hypothetical protein